MVAILKDTREAILVATDEPPGTSRCPAAPLSATPRPVLWADVPDSDWNNWRWQLSHRLNSLEELSAVVNLTPDEIEGISGQGSLSAGYYPVLRQPDRSRRPELSDPAAGYPDRP